MFEYIIYWFNAFKEDTNMKLYELCERIAFIEQGMMDGSISFECHDKLYFVMGRHPADDLDEILSPVGFPALSGLEVLIEQVQKLKNDLIDFKDEFHVKEFI